MAGHNCIKALTPRDVITPTGDGLYGQRTDLGWGIVGLVKGTWEDADGDDVETSHHTVVREVANDLSMPGGSGSAIFSLKNKIKEVIDPNSIMIMFEVDFNENYGDSKVLSEEDRKFIRILEKGISFRDGHYQMPLPFRDDMSSLPNNKPLALQRLRCLKEMLL